MFRILIKINEEKVKREQKYDLDGIYSVIKEVFQKLDLLQLESEPGILLYGDRGRDCDFCYFGLAIREFKNEKWFLESAEAWVFYEDASDTDLLLHYANRKSSCGINDNKVKTEEKSTSFRILIKIDENKVEREKKYDLDGIYGIIKEVFQKLNLRQLESEPGILLYGDRGRDCDFSYFGLAIREFKNEKWFLESAQAWIFYEDEINSETDLLLHYANRTSSIR